MLKYLVALAVVAAIAVPVSARKLVDRPETLTLVEYQGQMLPPADYRGQWWTTADNCEYSRAGRPGETVWYLVVNTAHEGCARRLIQRAYSDFQ